MKRLCTFFVKYKKETTIAVLLLFLSVISLVVINLVMPRGTYAEVRTDGELVATYPLSVDGEYLLHGGTNTLVIEDGEVYMKEADCPDGTCIKTGRIKQVGEAIVCLPNKISVTVVGDGGAGPELVPGSP
ncbi:MAG: NusG domain II-containing protein [Clostridia bacterium]|nr:NusG domain II-containing protein [Clostridia bacterium]